MSRLLPVDPSGYEPHPVHSLERVWTETNCSLDVWIEVLHARGLDPVPATLAALSADFQTDQWMFLKFPIEDLRTLYGITIDELNVWRPLLDHLDEQFDAGRLLTVEVDSWFLPDTAGVAYQRAHQKSTIVPNLVDRAGRRMEYFHNAGCWALEGDDFDGVFRLGKYADESHLAPYVELVGLDRVDPQRDLTEAAVRIGRDHVSRRPANNPIHRLGDRLAKDLAWLVERDLETFHQYSFGVVRQCGVSAELAAIGLRWLDEHGETGLAEPADAFDLVATGAKTLQFQLARAARGRSTSMDETLEAMADNWARAMALTVAWAEPGGTA